MTASIELVTVAGPGADPAGHTGWDLGPRRTAPADAAAIGTALATTGADAVLCLDADLPVPGRELLTRLLAGPADAWHAGLALGLDGQPRLFDSVLPTWMFNAPLDPAVEATSWRLSLRALLVRAPVVRQLGGPAGGFDTLAGSGLDLGHRWIRAGALLRHAPGLVPTDAPPDAPPTDADGLRLIAHHQGRAWVAWALQRGVVTRRIRPRRAAELWREVSHERRDGAPAYQPPSRPAGDLDRTVSVVIPTIDRYPYLVTLLGQLAAQTRPPAQVIVADQTPPDRRRHDLADVAPGLPVTVLELPTPGQSTARNAALGVAHGELVLFVDDDDEIGPDLVADHLARLGEGIDACCGGVDDATAGPPPEGFRHRRASDVFPTNNTMLRREALVRSGLFDPAFDGLPMEDHDLGMRLHQAGALLVYDPSVLVFHHHAPAGGLRVHGTRAVTRAGSRRSLTVRNLPAPTELYLGHRYGTARQRREDRAIRTVSTLAGDGTRGRRLVRALVQVALLADSRRRIRAADDAARRILATHRGVPALGTDGDPAP